MIADTNPRVLKSLILFAAALGLVTLFYFAYSRPWYFTSQTYLGGLILLEVVAVAVWRYRQVFFPAVIVVFLLAGADLPGVGVWNTARWIFLAVGALLGFLMLFKDRQHHFNVFHAIALFSVLTATVSVLVSRFSSLAMLKVASLFLLFLYAGSGVRLVARGSGVRFFAGLLTGCEILVAVLSVCYLVLGIDLMGNPNSLGAIMGVVVAPFLLWGALAGEDTTAKRRRFFLYVVSMYLVYYSRARAGIVAVAFVCCLLCIAMRRYRALVVGVVLTSILLASAAIIRPQSFFETVSLVTSDVVYKGHEEGGVFGSRKSRWQDAMDSIRSNFWFGTGFGTNDKGPDARKMTLSNFTSSSALNTEYGSSYLKLITWVGVLGVLPFGLLLLILIAKAAQTLRWMIRSGNPSHPAIPLAMVVLAGMLHAAFEDWMFAPGYYLCVFFWCMAFLLVDYAPSYATAAFQPADWRTHTAAHTTIRVAST